MMVIVEGVIAIALVGGLVFGLQRWLEYEKARAEGKPKK
jgi:hypothetical protein